MPIRPGTLPLNPGCSRWLDPPPGHDKVLPKQLNSTCSLYPLRPKPPSTLNLPDLGETWCSLPHLPTWAKSEVGTNRIPRILSVPSLPGLASHHPVASTEVLQGTSSCLQGVKVPALREEGEVETYHLGLI